MSGPTGSFEMGLKGTPGKAGEDEAGSVFSFQRFFIAEHKEGNWDNSLKQQIFSP